MSVEDAKNRGAIGLFESKYGNIVKVYTMGGFSREICGGPHASNTAELGRSDTEGAVVFRGRAPHQSRAAGTNKGLAWLSYGRRGRQMNRQKKGMRRYCGHVFYISIVF
jgi:hypothetical protein